LARQVRHRLTRLVRVRRGEARLGRLGRVCMARYTWLGIIWLGRWALQGELCCNEARQERFVADACGSAGGGMARQVWSGMSRRRHVEV
jgi:hypothetical protein